MNCGHKRANPAGKGEVQRLDRNGSNAGDHAKTTVEASLSWLRCCSCSGLTSRESAEATAAGLHLCAACGAPAVPVDLAAERDARRLLRGAQ